MRGGDRVCRGLFFCTATLPFGNLLDQTRMGALVSFSAAVITADAGALVLRVGRFGGGGKPAQESSIPCARPSRPHQEDGAKMNTTWMARHREVAIALRDVET
jgi:hypothetical protein